MGGEIILALTLLANVVLGLLVIGRDSKSVTNRLFFLLLLSMSAWSIANYLSYKNTDALEYARLVLCFAVAFAMFFFLFVLTYPRRSSPLSLGRMLLVLVWSLIVMSVTLSPFAFKHIVAGASSSIGKPIVGPGIGLFGITVVFYDLGGLLILARKTIHSHGEERSRRLYLFIGLALMLATIILLNFILPSAFSNTRFIPLAPVLILPFVVFTTYAIVKHRLLDIRTAAARGLAYLLSLGSIGLVYGGIIYLFSSRLTHSNKFSGGVQAFYIAFALITAIAYPTVKDFFDTLTKRIFFRDSYDSQDILDRIGSIAVAHIDLYPILKETRTVLNEALKSTYVEFLLHKNDKFLFEERTSNKLDPKILGLKNFISEQRADLIETKPDSTSHIHEKFTEADVALSLCLKTKEQVVGYIIFGSKKSGNAYTTQDKKLLLIVANELALAIQNALRFEQIQNFNFVLQARVDDATRKLRHANEKLKSLDETKDDFISMASHQLRSPLTSVKGYLSLVLEGDAGKLTKVQKDMLNQAFQSSQRMVYLIADLLNVSRLKTGKFVIESQTVDLSVMVEQELAQLHETALHRDITLDYDKPDKFPELTFDETKTRQVIMNFVDNAIYYTPPKGTINIILENKPNTIELKVKDNGIGVPKSEQPHLFTKFYRAGNARKARPDGTGLGLFMAKKVIVAQGGSLIFESKEGAGSTFGFIMNKADHALK